MTRWDLSKARLRERMSGATREVVKAARRAIEETISAVRDAGEAPEQEQANLPAGRLAFVSWCSLAIKHGENMVDACENGNSAGAWQTWRAMLEAVARGVWAWDRSPQELDDARKAELSSAGAGGGKLLFGRTEPDWFKNLGSDRDAHTKAIKRLRELTANYPAGENRDETGRPTSINVEDMLNSMAHSGAMALPLLHENGTWKGSACGDKSIASLAVKAADTVTVIGTLLIPELAADQRLNSAGDRMARAIHAWQPVSRRIHGMA